MPGWNWRRSESEEWQTHGWQVRLQLGSLQHRRLVPCCQARKFLKIRTFHQERVVFAKRYFWESYTERRRSFSITLWDSDSHCSEWKGLFLLKDTETLTGPNPHSAVPLTRTGHPEFQTIPFGSGLSGEVCSEHWPRTQLWPLWLQWCLEQSLTLPHTPPSATELCCPPRTIRARTTESDIPAELQPCCKPHLCGVGENKHLLFYYHLRDKLIYGR